MQETLELKRSLRKAVEDYKRERPSLSVRAIAKNSGVNRYFLNKLLDESDESAALDLNQVLILSKYITQRNSLSEAIGSSSRVIKDALLKVFPIDHPYAVKEIASIYDRVDLSDKTTYFVLVLATYQLGTKREYVSRIFGDRGERALKELMDHDIIQEQDGVIRLVEGNDFTCDFKIMFQRITDYLSFYRFERPEESFLQIVSEGVNKETLKKIRKIHLNAACQISALLAKEENLGDIPFFTVTCMDRMIDRIDD